MYYQLDENGYLCAYSFDTVLPGGVLYRGRVPEDFDEESFDCWKIEEDTLTFDEGRQRARREGTSDREELAELMAWFEQYDRQVMEYQRCICLLYTSNRISSGVGEMWDGVTAIFSAAWDVIRDIFSVVVEFFAGIWSGIKEAFASAAEWFGKIFRSAWKGICLLYTSSDNNRRRKHGKRDENAAYHASKVQI